MEEARVEMASLKNDKESMGKIISAQTQKYPPNPKSNAKCKSCEGVSREKELLENFYEEEKEKVKQLEKDIECLI